MNEFKNYFGPYDIRILDGNPPVIKPIEEADHMPWVESLAEGTGVDGDGNPFLVGKVCLFADSPEGRERILRTIEYARKDQVVSHFHYSDAQGFKRVATILSARRLNYIEDDNRNFMLCIKYTTPQE